MHTHFQFQFSKYIINVYNNDTIKMDNRKFHCFYSILRIEKLLKISNNNFCKLRVTYLVSY